MFKKQSTCETCLPVCLMHLLKEKGFKMKDSEEINILINGLKFTKIDYSTGQLNYICKKYNLKIEQCVDSKEFYKKLSRLSIPKNLILMHKKINKRILIDLLIQSPIIIYLDNYYVNKEHHYPHFVILTSLGNKYSNILDPWMGKKKILPTNTLMKSIQSLRNNIKISPKIIRIL